MAFLVAISALSVGLKIEIVLAIIFVIFLIGYLLKNRKHVVLQKIAFPLLYIFMLRRGWGLKAMDKVAKKQRELVKLFGSMAFMVYLFGQIGIWLFTEPAKAMLAPVVPFVTLPGVGFLGFTHWILAISFLVIVHEFAHGMVARAHGVKVKSSGLAVLGLIAPIFPAAFVEPDTKEMAKKGDIVQYSVFAAGSFMNLLWFLVFWAILLLAVNPAMSAMTEPVGFSFNLVNGTSPAALSGVGNLTLVNMYNGEFSTDAAIVINEVFYGVSPGEPVEFGYYNKTTNKTTSYTITTGNHPDEEKRAFLGIINIQNKRDFKEKFKPYSPYFLWVQGLIKWLVLFNLLVGIFNMLPLVITDGGQMFMLALTRILGDRKKAAKVTNAIGLVIGAIMLAGIGVWISSFF